MKKKIAYALVFKYVAVNVTSFYLPLVILSKEKNLGLDETFQSCRNMRYSQIKDNFMPHFQNVGLEQNNTAYQQKNIILIGKHGGSDIMVWGYFV